MSTLPIPNEPGEMSETWLTDALRATGILTNGRVTRAAHERIAEGVGLLSRIYRFTLEYDRADAQPKQVVVKIPAANPENRALCLAFHFYRREINFFRHFPGWAHLPVPRCYYADVDTEGRQFVLLLEDLHEYTMGNQIRGATAKEVFQIVELMAKTHAQFWNRLPDTHADWLIDPRAPFHAGVAENMYRDALPGTVRTFSSRITPALRKAAEGLAGYVPVFWERMMRPPITFIHGDMRLDNLAFGHEGTRYPLAMIDFQICMRGRGAYDLSYFMSQSVPVEVRRSIGSEAVRRYHDVLLEHGVTDYDFQTCMLDYRRSVLYVLAYPVIVCGHLNANDERARAFGELFLDRSLSAIEDTAAAEVLSESQRS